MMCNNLTDIIYEEESVVEVPEKIGKYVVTGISEKAFSAYAPRLTDKEKISRKMNRRIL